MIGFEQQPPIYVYGDGNGNIVFEEWDYKENIVGKVTMSLQRFEEMVHMHFDELKKEAFDNPIVKGEQND